MVKIKRLLLASLIIGVLTPILLFGAWLAAAATLAAHPKPAVHPAPATQAQAVLLATAEGLLKAVNEQRRINGVPPLTIRAELMTSAKQKCDDMAAGGYWGHVNPKTGVPGVDYATALFPKTAWKKVGENLQKGPHDTAEASVLHWMGSPPHREAILYERYNYTGFAICSIPAFPGTVATVEHFAQLP